MITDLTPQAQELANGARRDWKKFHRFLSVVSPWPKAVTVRSHGSRDNNAAIPAVWTGGEIGLEKHMGGFRMLQLMGKRRIQLPSRNPG